MKLSNTSIKWKVFGFIALFTVIMLVILWLFQIVFLDGFYRRIKTREISMSGDVIYRNINNMHFVDFIHNEQLENLIYDISQNKDICVYIIDMNLNEYYSSDVLNNCLIHHLTPSEYYKYYQEARSGNGRYLQKYKIKAVHGRFSNYPVPSGLLGAEGMIYASIATLADGREILVMMNSIITPVGSTVKTLRIQLIYISVVFIILALLIALYISKVISEPIVKINESARQLAKGNYSIKFEGQGYKEIEELNETLNYASRELSKVENLRRELIANVSHDLRTPLTMIAGYAEVIKDIPGENTPENVQVIIDETNRLAELVSNLLDISKYESGAQQLDLEKYSITHSVKDILNRYQKLREQEGYDISFEHTKDITVYADKKKIEQVIYNLISNAIAYTGADKKVTLRQTERGYKVRIEVIDTGIGIEKQKLPYIWERYYKAGENQKRAHVGTGLGLYIVKKILDLHKTNYGVMSTVGEGSNFWFELNIFHEGEL